MTDAAFDVDNYGGWSFSDLFRIRRAESEIISVKKELSSDLIEAYPENAFEIIEFIGNALRRRQPIVEYLKDFPELNNHGFFMVMCKMYRDTYHGIGHTHDRTANLIIMFSSADISHSTASRTLQKAVAANVFTTRKDDKDKRKLRYYLHGNMIKLLSHAFGGMIDDINHSREM
jgi:hypothetical protein